MRNKVSLSNVVCAAVGAVALSSGVAVAQNSNATSLDEHLAQDSNVQFQLTPQHDATSLRFAAPREMRICDLTGTDVSDSSAQDYPLETWPLLQSTQAPMILSVSYGGKTHEIDPGECDQFRASEVQLSTVRPLAGETLLAGEISVLHRTPSISVAPNDEDLTAQLSRDDRMLRESTAEFRQARDSLRSAQRSLEATRRAETGVQKDETAVRDAEIREASLGS